MSLSVLGTGQGLSSAAAGAAGRTRIEPVQAVAGNTSAPRRDVEGAIAGGSASGGLAALLLGRGGTVAASPQAPDAAATKPNLDALNRVLAHYVAQSAAAARLRP